MSGRVIYVIVDIICLVDYDRVFLKVLDASTTIKIYALICTPDFFQSMRTFVTIVQIYFIRCTLKGIPNIDSVYSCY